MQPILSTPFKSNDGLQMRLGNECRDYSEFGFSHIQEDFKVHWMIDVAGDSRSPTAVESWSRRNRKLYVETDKFIDNGTLWLGRRYYRVIGGVSDINILDGFPLQSSGNGVGVENIEHGDNTYHLALMGYGAELATIDGQNGTGATNYQ